MKWNEPEDISPEYAVSANSPDGFYQFCEISDFSKTVTGTFFRRASQDLPGVLCEKRCLSPFFAARREATSAAVNAWSCGWSVGFDSEFPELIMMRGKGFIPFARSVGLERLLQTCDDDNIASGV